MLLMDAPFLRTHWPAVVMWCACVPSHASLFLFRWLPWTTGVPLLEIGTAQPMNLRPVVCRLVYMAIQTYLLVHVVRKNLSSEPVGPVINSSHPDCENARYQVRVAAGACARF